MNKCRLMTAWRITFLLAALMIVIAIANVSPVPSLAQDSDHVYIPMIKRAAYNTNPIYKGIASFYPANGQGNCQFVPPAPEDLMVAAINQYQYDGSKICGSYVNVTGPKGSVIVRIVDFCPSCGNYQLDMSYEAFDKIGYRSRGYADITWQVVSPDLKGPIGYHWMEGANVYWPAMNIRNSRNPIAKIEYYSASGKWENLPRTDLNWFLEQRKDKNGVSLMGLGPFTFRVTDIYGNVLIDKNIKLVENSVQPGAKQFPPFP